MLVTETRGKARVESQGQLLHMIPELMSARARTKRRRVVGKSVNESANSTKATTFKMSKRSMSKGHRR